MRNVVKQNSLSARLLYSFQIKNLNGLTNGNHQGWGKKFNYLKDLNKSAYERPSRGYPGLGRDVLFIIQKNVLLRSR